MTEKIQVQAQTSEPTNPFLSSGAHIGTVFKSGDMRRYIFKRRKDGLLVLNVENIETRLKMAAALISGYPPQSVVIVSRRLYAKTGAQKLGELIGARVLTGRFIPGTFSNPTHKQFVEPKIVLVAEPDADSQAISEAAVIHIPVIALVSTNNSLRNIDLAIPINNKGRRSLALAFWTLAREILLKRGTIKNETGFSEEVSDFEYQLASAQGGEEDPIRQAIQEGRELRRRQSGKRFGASRRPAGRGRFGERDRSTESADSDSSDTRPYRSPAMRR